MTLNNASRIAWILLSLAILALLWRHELFGTGPVTISIQILAIILWGWARATFGRRSFHGSASPTQGGLVTTGPYRLWRHPIYASLLYLVWAGVAAHPSMVSVPCAVAASAAVAIRIWAEERLLFQRYPEYAAYAAKTKRVLPFVL